MNQEKRSVEPGSCILPEKISAFLDGEEELSPAEEQHFHSCPECQKLFRSYRNMGMILAGALEEEVKKIPESERILEKVHERLFREYGVPYPESGKKKKEERILFRSIPHLVKVAAILLFLLFASLLILQFHKEENKDVPRVAQRQDAAERLPEEPAGEGLPRMFSSVDIDSLVPVAASNSPIRFLPENQTGKNPVLIPFQVKQLWLFPGKKISVGSLEKMLGGKLTVNGKEYIYKGESTRAKTVELVRKLAEKKFKLLTPVPPQPEDIFFQGTGKEKVQLYITFLPEE